jgi:hypothetical protein
MKLYGRSGVTLRCVVHVNDSRTYWKPKVLEVEADDFTRNGTHLKNEAATPNQSRGHSAVHRPVRL